MNVWDALESSRGLTAVAASWRERLGDQFDSFKTAFLQRAPGVAKGMPCPRGCGCTHEIVTSDEWTVSSAELSTLNSPPSTIPAPSPRGEGRGEGFFACDGTNSEIAKPQAATAILIPTATNVAVGMSCTRSK
jgi:hypothetical protein